MPSMNSLVERLLSSSGLLSWAFWLCLAACLFTLLELCWLGGHTWWRMLNPSKAEWLTWRLGRVTQLLLSPRSGTLFFLGLGFLLGWTAKKADVATKTNHMRNVEITRKYGDHYFRVRSIDIDRSYNMLFCPDYAPNWEEGEILTDLVYEDTGKCKSLSSGWYTAKYDVDGSYVKLGDQNETALRKDVGMDGRTR